MFDSLKMRLFFVACIVALSVFTGRAFAEPVEVTLSWNAPTDRVDGTPLSLEEIAGYRIYGVEPGATSPDMVFLYDTFDGVNTQHTFQYNLTLTGIYSASYAVTVYDTEGRESAFSEIVDVGAFVVGSDADPRETAKPMAEVICGAGCVIRFFDPALTQ